MVENIEWNGLQGSLETPCYEVWMNCGKDAVLCCVCCTYSDAEKKIKQFNERYKEYERIKQYSGRIRPYHDRKQPSGIETFWINEITLGKYYEDRRKEAEYSELRYTKIISHEELVRNNLPEFYRFVREHLEIGVHKFRPVVKDGFCSDIEYLFVRLEPVKTRPNIYSLEIGISFNSAWNETTSDECFWLLATGTIAGIKFAIDKKAFLKKVEDFFINRIWRAYPILLNTKNEIICNV